MPTPALKGAASITQRTGGFRSPWSIEAVRIFFMSRSGWRLRSGVKPRSFITTNATTNITQQNADAEEERHAERGRLRDHAAGDRTAQHRHAADHLAAAEHGFQRPVVAGEVRARRRATPRPRRRRT